MTPTPSPPTNDDVGHVDAILSCRPLDPNNNISSNPSVPSVSASAVLGESESVRWQAAFAGEGDGQDGQDTCLRPIETFDV